VSHGRSGLTHHVAANDELLDLGRVFIESEETHVAVKALNAIVGQINGAAQNLHGPIGHAATHFAGKHLAARRFGGHGTTFIAFARGIDHHAFGRIEFGLAVGQQSLHQLKIAYRLAKLLALDRITQRIRSN